MFTVQLVGTGNIGINSTMFSNLQESCKSLTVLQSERARGDMPKSHSAQCGEAGEFTESFFETFFREDFLAAELTCQRWEIIRHF